MQSSLAFWSVHHFISIVQTASCTMGRQCSGGTKGMLQHLKISISVVKANKPQTPSLPCMQPPDSSPSPPAHTSSAAPPSSHAKPMSKFLLYRDKRVSATSRDTCPPNLQRGQLRDGELTQQTWKMLLWCATAQSISHTRNQRRMVYSETFSKCSHTLSQFESLCAGAKLCL